MLHEQGTYKEDDAADDDEEERQVKEDVEDVVELERLPTGPLVQTGVDADCGQEAAQRPEQQVAEEYGVLDAGRDVREVPASAPQASSVPAFYCFIPQQL